MRDFINELGELALGSRLKRLADVFYRDAALIYERAGLSFQPRWFPLLRFLLVSPPVSVSDAAATLGVSHAAISQIARDMRKAGLVDQQPSSDDRRKTLMTLTAHGLETAAESASLWRRVRGAVESLLGPEDTLLSEIARLEAALAERSMAQRVLDDKRRESISVVPFDEADPTAFSRLNRRWLEAHFEVEEVDERLLGDPRGEILVDGGHILYAIDTTGNVVGTCALIREGQHAFELAKMAVDERVQRQGIGRRLLDAAIEFARLVGARSISLRTNTKLDTAIRLYERAGFVVVQRGPHPQYRRADLAMRLDLPSSTEKPQSQLG